MPNREKLEKKAKVALEKAEILMDNERFKRAAESFRKAGEYFSELSNWKIAEQCFYYASKNYTRLEGERNFQRTAVMEREAGKCCIYLNQFQKAQDYFNVSGKTELKAEDKTRPEYATESFCFAFFCYFLQGEVDEGIEYIKRIKSRISNDLFAKHPLMLVVRRITNAYLKKKESYLDEIIDSLNSLHYDKAEMRLIKETLIVSLATLMMDFTLVVEKQDFERDEIVNVQAKISYDRLKEFENYSVVPRQFNSIEIIDTHIEIGENISTKDRPLLPISLDMTEFIPKSIPYTFRTNFPGKSFIGPISLILEMDGTYKFELKSNKQEIEITSPQAILGIDLKPLKTPIINQTFPLEVRLSNQSDGNAMQIEVEFEFPEDLRLMRGTNQKTIYSLNPNEDIAWNLQVKAFDVGKIPIKAMVSFSDEDGNKKGPFKAEIPIEINM